MIVYKEEERISFSDILHHSVMKARGIEETVVFNAESINFKSVRF